MFPKSVPPMVSNLASATGKYPGNYLKQIKQKGTQECNNHLQHYCFAVYTHTGQTIDHPL